MNFGSTFISSRSREWREEFGTHRSKFLAEKEIEWNHPEARAYLEGYKAALPFPYATVSDVADHIEHIVKIAGIEATSRAKWKLPFPVAATSSRNSA